MGTSVLGVAALHLLGAPLGVCVTLSHIFKLSEKRPVKHRSGFVRVVDN